MRQTPFVQQGGAEGETLCLESGAVGAQGVERVGFVHEPGDGDAHGRIVLLGPLTLTTGTSYHTTA